MKFTLNFFQLSEDGRKLDIEFTRSPDGDTSATGLSFIFQKMKLLPRSFTEQSNSDEMLYPKCHLHSATIYDMTKEVTSCKHIE